MLYCVKSSIWTRKIYLSIIAELKRSLLNTEMERLSVEFLFYYIGMHVTTSIVKFYVVQMNSSHYTAVESKRVVCASLFYHFLLLLGLSIFSNALCIPPFPTLQNRMSRLTNQPFRSFVCSISKFQSYL